MKIVGIILIKNEDLYIERVLLNVVDFCDEIIVLDNMSTDNTYAIVKKLAQKYPSIKPRMIASSRASHAVVSPYAGTPTWFFKVDGDEIYDPLGLKKMREKIMAGEYQNYWRIDGNSLNCTEIDLENAVAAGYLSPPAKPAPLLYNFSLIRSWDEKNTERLHGRNIKFKDGFSENNRLSIFEKYNWEESPFRCLHICFVKRSSLESDKTSARMNPNENHSFFSKTINFLRNLLKRRVSFESTYKLDKYKMGDLYSKKIDNFIKTNPA